ncbi:hypothetical protein [Brasilonema sp. UFV-L1]|uniref:hypothetical protein n=1 Tax=Brasilonema sp. UFV-L1 TaxID=2234130 RepID=UPI00145F751B|nr:hypothetical protein [Brasilonema sp. UFV-L1]NMG11864.1 hypothetical protein [Brasilonema sp. UFV-L1]
MATKRQQRAALVDGNIDVNHVGFPTAEPMAESSANSSITRQGDKPSFNLDNILSTVNLDEKPSASNLEMYSGVMDVASVNPDSITVESLLADQSLRMSGAEAGKRIAELQQVQNGLNVKIEEVKTRRLGVKLQTQQVKLAGDAYELSSAMSDTRQKGNTAKHKKFMADVKGVKEKFERIEAVSDVVITAGRAQKRFAKARNTLLEEMPGFEEVSGVNALEGGKTDE